MNTDTGNSEGKAGFGEDSEEKARIFEKSSPAVRRTFINLCREQGCSVEDKDKLFEIGSRLYTTENINDMKELRELVRKVAAELKKIQEEEKPAEEEALPEAEAPVPPLEDIAEGDRIHTHELSNFFETYAKLSLGYKGVEFSQKNNFRSFIEHAGREGKIRMEENVFDRKELVKVVQDEYDTFFPNEALISRDEAEAVLKTAEIPDEEIQPALDKLEEDIKHYEGRGIAGKEGYFNEAVIKRLIDKLSKEEEKPAEEEAPPKEEMLPEGSIEEIVAGMPTQAIDLDEEFDKDSVISEKVHAYIGLLNHEHGYKLNPFDADAVESIIRERFGERESYLREDISAVLDEFAKNPEYIRTKMREDIENAMKEHKLLARRKEVDEIEEMVFGDFEEKGEEPDRPVSTTIIKGFVDTYVSQKAKKLSQNELDAFIAKFARQRFGEKVEVGVGDFLYQVGRRVKDDAAYHVRLVGGLLEEPQTDSEGRPYLNSDKITSLLEDCVKHYEAMHKHMTEFKVPRTEEAEENVVRTLLKDLGDKPVSSIDDGMIERAVAMIGNLMSMERDYNLRDADDEEIIDIIFGKLKDEPYDINDTNVIEQAVITYDGLRKKRKKPEPVLQGVGGKPMRKQFIPEESKGPESPGGGYFRKWTQILNLHLKDYLIIAGIVLAGFVAYYIFGRESIDYKKLANQAKGSMNAAVAQYVNKTYGPPLKGLEAELAAQKAKAEGIEKKVDDYGKTQEKIDKKIEVLRKSGNKLSENITAARKDAEAGTKEVKDGLEQLTGAHKAAVEIEDMRYNEEKMAKKDAAKEREEAAKERDELREIIESNYEDASARIADLHKTLKEGFELSKRMREEVTPGPGEGEKPEVVPGEKPEVVPGEKPEVVPGEVVEEKKVEKKPRRGIYLRDLTLGWETFTRHETVGDLTADELTQTGKFRAYIGETYTLQLGLGVDADLGTLTGDVEGNKNITDYRLGLRWADYIGDVKINVEGYRLIHTRDHDGWIPSDNVKFNKLGKLRGWGAEVDVKNIPVYNLSLRIRGYYSEAEGGVDTRTYVGGLGTYYKDSIDTKIERIGVMPELLLWNGDNFKVAFRLIYGREKLDERDISYTENRTGAGLMFEVPFSKSAGLTIGVEDVYYKRRIEGAVVRKKNGWEAKGVVGFNVKFW